MVGCALHHAVTHLPCPLTPHPTSTLNLTSPHLSPVPHLVSPHLSPPPPLPSAIPHPSSPVAQVWLAPVNAVVPESGFHIWWNGLWMDKAEGVSMNALSYITTRAFVQDTMIRLLQHKLNRTQVVRAALFDLLTSQCDRYGEGLPGWQVSGGGGYQGCRWCTPRCLTCSCNSVTGTGGGCLGDWYGSSQCDG